MCIMQDRSPLERAVDKAWAYHPFRQPEPLSAGGWVIGPTFVVKGEYTNAVDGEEAPIWKADPFLGMKAKGILASVDEATEEVFISKGGHPKVQEFKVDKFGAEHPATAKKCTCRYVTDDAGNQAGEIAFPLLSLAKKVGCVTFKSPAAGGIIFGFNKGGELVGVFALKLAFDCLPEEEEAE